MRNNKSAYITLKHLTNYMTKKFSNYRLRAHNAAPSLTGTCFRYTYIVNELKWIKSIIKVEFDFHLGDKVCMRPENRHYLQDYCESKISGYGEPFYSRGRIHDISYASFAQLFG